MHGLNEIKSINEGAALAAEEKSRRSAGLKPASPTGKVLRSILPAATRRPAAKTVITQGRERRLG